MRKKVNKIQHELSFPNRRVEEVRGIRTIDIVNIILISVMWLAVIVGNVIIKKIQPGFSKLYFFYSMGIALGITVFAILYKRP